MDAQRVQRAHAAHPEQDFLLNARLPVAAVEVFRDGAVARLILRNVGVEQVQRHAPDLGLPDLRMQRAPAQRHGDLAAGVADRQRGEIVSRVDDTRGAVAAQLLAVVAAAVQQPDGHERDAQIGRGLEVVARQHAQPAGIQRQALVQPELGTEIGDAHPLLCRRGGALEPCSCAKILRELLLAHAQQAGEIAVAGQHRAPFRRQGRQGLERVVVRRFPQHGIQGGEQPLRIRIPGPPQIVRKHAYPLQDVADYG